MLEMEEGNSDDRAIAGEYAKAIQKDQIAKLLCFTTRPAIYSPMYNWLCEFMSTIMLVRPALKLGACRRVSQRRPRINGRTVPSLCAVMMMTLSDG